METKESMNKKQVLDINPDHLLDFTCELGILLLRNGAEIYRVEESVQRVLEIYGMSGINVFAIPSLILINFSADGHNYSKSVRVRGTINNMERLNRLNALCRDICGGVLDFSRQRVNCTRLSIALCIRAGPVTWPTARPRFSSRSFGAVRHGMRLPHWLRG